MKDLLKNCTDIVPITDEHLKELRAAGYQEIDVHLKERGDIVDGKFVPVPVNNPVAWVEAPYELRVFKKFLELDYKGPLAFVNKTELEDVIVVVAHA